MDQALNKSLIRERFSKSLESYREAANLQYQMGTRLIQALAQMENLPHAKTLEIGCGCGLLTEQLLEVLAPEHLLMNDLVPESFSQIVPLTRKYPKTGVEFIPGDIEEIKLGRDYLDLIVSNAVLQWVEDLSQLSHKLYRALRPDGVLAFTTFGPHNLQEVRQLTGSGLRYQSLDQLIELFSPGFDIIWAEAEQHQVLFDTPRQVLHHMKQTGVTGIQSKPWTKQRLRDFEKNYSEKFSVPGGVTLTYEPIYLILRSK